MGPGDDEWRLTGQEGTTCVAVGGDQYEQPRGVCNAALNGLGIALLPECLVVDDLRAGRLEHVVLGYESETAAAYIVYPSRQHLAPRTRVVIDFLVEEVPPSMIWHRRLDHRSVHRWLRATP
jgi:DNA-binding transcriptional LysR family regulator